MTVQKYINSGIARKAITILLNREHPFEIGYNRIGTLTPSIEITFKYKFQGKICTITIKPVDRSDLMEIETLIEDW